MTRNKTILLTEDSGRDYFSVTLLASLTMELTYSWSHALKVESCLGHFADLYRDDL